MNGSRTNHQLGKRKRNSNSRNWQGRSARAFLESPTTEVVHVEPQTRGRAYDCWLIVRRRRHLVAVSTPRMAHCTMAWRGFCDWYRKPGEVSRKNCWSRKLCATGSRSRRPSPCLENSFPLRSRHLGREEASAAGAGDSVGLDHARPGSGRVGAGIRRFRRRAARLRRLQRHDRASPGSARRSGCKRATKSSR